MKKLKGGRKDVQLRRLKSIRNLGWALSAIGGGLKGMSGLEFLERLAVYTIVAGTIVSVGSQAIINEMENMDGDIGPSGGGGAWIIYRNKGIKN
ncbi:hypothetical protein QRD02_12105 [Aequorivita sp. SDUM287046]|uniref:Holin n=1 Tax=Aequorivita aurantiaca TaxID=3053356 RepID=A0ABT8DJW8_9FLAO|nr:hypothetical protein [Aequorivita aurantiaca]MDN3725129.1 hypothetical protein [Aequorivita aurantiaca]